MARAPFGEHLLGNSTYGSRIEELITRPVNYILTGFKPGYALQASELNELQEQFYLQQTLTTQCLYNWKAFSGTSSISPFWEGASPLSPDQISYSNGSAIANAGWYYLRDSTTSVTNGSLNSGMGFWVYLNTNLSLAISSSDLNTTTNTRYGLSYDIETITISEDSTLEDNANAANVSMSIPGADRIKITNFSLVKHSSTLARFSDLFGGIRTSSSFTLNWPFSNYNTTIVTVNT